MKDIPLPVTVNIDSATAERIAQQFIQYKYFEAIATLLFFAALFAGAFLAIRWFIKNDHVRF